MDGSLVRFPLYSKKKYTIHTIQQKENRAVESVKLQKRVRETEGSTNTTHGRLPVEGHDLHLLP